jgi:hypothetical protein
MATMCARADAVSMCLNTESSVDLITMSSFKKVYDLRDHELLGRRAVGASHGPVRVKYDHGEISSAEWWDAIANGQLTLRTVEGRIVRIFGSGLPASDWPEFEIEASGVRTRWSRHVSVGAADSRERREAIAMYQVGRLVRLQYVQQPVEPPLPGRAFIETVLNVWISDDDDVDRPRS